ncbi:MAG: Dabb family protein [Verrucomicrobiales bacterium]|nr:Dabb family protein [Verrucomicrobiales bacterium]
MSKYLVLWAAMVFIGLSSVTMMTLADDSGDAKQKGSNSHVGHFRHVVFFKFKEGTSRAKVDEIVKAFGALKAEIPTIIDYEWGTSESVEKLNDGFTHSFLVTFKDKAGLDAYLPSDPHQAFVKMLKPHLDKVMVFDYTAKD